MADEDWRRLSGLYVIPLRPLLDDLHPRLESYGAWLGRQVFASLHTGRKRLVFCESRRQAEELVADLDQAPGLASLIRSEAALLPELVSRPPQVVLPGVAEVTGALDVRLVTPPDLLAHVED